MDNLLQDFDKIILEITEGISEKLMGVGYLEKIKYPIIDRFKSVDFSKIKLMKNYKFSYKNENNNISIELIDSLDSTSKIKNVLRDDYLSIVLKGSKSIQVYEKIESSKSTILNLYSNLGIVFCKDTIISEMISGDCIMLELYSTKLDPDIEILSDNLVL